jgi:RHS repeat-associated protein
LSGTITKEFVFFGAKRIARRDFPSGAVHYYISDHLGSASLVASASGVIEEDSDYYPYGGERAYIDTLDDQNYKFTSKQRDVESDLDYFGARYYGNSVGRFLTPDWAAKPANVPYAQFGNPQSLNLYGYLKNAPVTGIDRDGHEGGVDFLGRILDIFTGNGAERQGGGGAAESVTNESSAKRKIEKLNEGAEKVYAVVPDANFAKSVANKDTVDVAIALISLAPWGEAERAGFELHHFLPRQFEKQFARAGLDIEKFTAYLSQAEHRLNPDGLHTASGGNWNAVWKDFFEKNPNASAAQILTQLQKMLKDFKINARLKKGRVVPK